MSADHSSGSDSDRSPKIEELHLKACEQGLESYTDPESGYLVFTAIYHKKRGFCCESGCRHCPYGFSKSRT